MIIKYRTFKSSTEFEDWQDSNEVNIMTIAPLYTSFDVDKGDIKDSIEIGSNLGIFVTYSNKETKNA